MIETVRRYYADQLQDSKAESIIGKGNSIPIFEHDPIHSESVPNLDALNEKLTDIV